jgi:hypothetical protein
MIRRIRGSFIKDLKLKKKEKEKLVLPQGLDYSYRSDTGQV